MQYTEAKFAISADESFVADVLTQQLADIGFESFSNPQAGQLAAYIPSKHLAAKQLDELLAQFPFEGVSLLSIEQLEDKDWNEEWERNSFQPIQIGSECLIHAPFHKDLPSCKYDVIINPKMAFGTGTHQTTSLILAALLDMQIEGKSLLDMGCGTAVLAILARKKGAQPVTAIDIDDWCTQNAAENCQLNNISDIDIQLGDARLIAGKQFDIILANINRNILLMDMPRYNDALLSGGTLIISGFYQEDIAALNAKAATLGLQLINSKHKDNWAMMILKKL